MEFILYGLCVVGLAVLIVHLIHPPYESIQGLSQHLPFAGRPDSSEASVPPGSLYAYDPITMFQRVDSLARASERPDAASVASRRLLDIGGVATSIEQAILMQQPYN